MLFGKRSEPKMNVVWFKRPSQGWTRKFCKIPPTFNIKNVGYKLYLS